MKPLHLIASLTAGILEAGRKFPLARKLSIRRIAVLAVLFAALACFGGPALADSALLSKSGTLYEVYPARYGDVVAGVAAGEARTPILALRMTPPGGQPTVEVVYGTLNDNEEGAQSIEFDETTQTVFIVYTQFQGLMAQVHVAIRRGGRWVEQNILPSSGLYLSLNPQVLVTRQSFLDFSGTNGQIVAKWRSILSLIWWEEGDSSQARYAAVFVEDGVLRLDNIVAYNLNVLAREGGTTDAMGLPVSSYSFPAIQRDPTTNGGALVSFANLATQRQIVLRINFPDDIRTFVLDGSVSAGPQAYARSHIPIGGPAYDGRIPRQIDTNEAVGTLISPAGVPTFYWSQNSGGKSSVNFLRGDAVEATTPTSLALRPDFSLDRAIILLREMADKD